VKTTISVYGSYSYEFLNSLTGPEIVRPMDPPWSLRFSLWGWGKTKPRVSHRGEACYWPTGFIPREKTRNQNGGGGCPVPDSDKR